MSNDLSYAHANMRLKTRYDFEISFEEWDALGHRFRTKGVADVRKNHVGDLEGWVLLHEVWVCAYYSVRRKCVSTFFARPPDPPNWDELKKKVADEERARVKVQLEKRIERVHKTCEKRAARLQQEIQHQAKQLLQEEAKHTTRDRGAELVVAFSDEPKLLRHRFVPDLSKDPSKCAVVDVVDGDRCGASKEQHSYNRPAPTPVAPPAPQQPAKHVQPPPKSAYTADDRHRDLRWLKNRLGDVEALLLRKDFVGAYVLLNAIRSMPRDLRPGSEEPAAEAWIEECTAKESRWAEKRMLGTSAEPAT